MDKKQYNNIIDWTLNNEEQAQCEDSLTVARAVCTNLGVALPQGNLSQVAEVLATNDYMGWKACTKEEAQASADVGTPAISVSNDRIVVLAATDEEQPMAATATVMTLADGNAFVGNNVVYYSYSGGTTVSRIFNDNYLISQFDKKVLYPEDEQPGTEERVFYDELFYTSICQKNAGTGTIKEYGCAICSMAMYLLFKSNKQNTDNGNIYEAVKAATIQGTDSYSCILPGHFTLSYSGVTANVSAFQNNVSMEMLDNALYAGKMCIVFINRQHFVLIYGFNPTASVNSTTAETDRYMVADPGVGVCHTLTEAMRNYVEDEGLSKIHSMREIC